MLKFTLVFFLVAAVCGPSYAGSPPQNGNDCAHIVVRTIDNTIPNVPTAYVTIHNSCPVGIDDLYASNGNGGNQIIPAGSTKTVQVFASDILKSVTCVTTTGSGSAR